MSTHFYIFLFAGTQKLGEGKGVAAPGEVISRIQRTVSYEFVHVAMEGVRARLDDRVYDSASGLPVFGREAAGQNGELLMASTPKALPITLPGPLLA